MEQTLPPVVVAMSDPYVTLLFFVGQLMACARGFSCTHEKVAPMRMTQTKCDDKKGRALLRAPFSHLEGKRRGGHAEGQREDRQARPHPLRRREPAAGGGGCRQSRSRASPPSQCPQQLGVRL
jgi:hypothetical protein